MAPAAVRRREVLLGGSRLSPFLESNAAGEIGYLQEWNHSTGEILCAALGAGFRVLDCQELVADLPADEYDAELELPEPGPVTETVTPTR